MGARGNIVVKQHDQNATGELYLYTHWGGEYLPLFLQTTLARRARWNDETFLARMLFCSFLNADDPEDIKSEGGLGISTYLTDNEYPLLIVDTEKMTVTMRDPEDPGADRCWSFEAFVGLALDAEEPWQSLGFGEDDDDEDPEDLPPRHFELKDDKSSKFWEIELQGEEFTVRFGKIGTKGQTQTKEFDDAEQARAEYIKLIGEKLKKGYKESKP